jgi:8-oxo-dGTP diphosphatase
MSAKNHNAVMEKQDIIKVGVACFVFRGSKLLLGQRVSESHGGGEYSCGGGHAEFMEDLTETARREIREEWRIEIGEPEFVCLTDLKKYSGKHYVEVIFKADWVSGEPSPEREGEFANYDWYDLEDLPSPLFAGVVNGITALKTGQRYFEMQAGDGL